MLLLSVPTFSLRPHKVAGFVACHFWTNFVAKGGLESHQIKQKKKKKQVPVNIAIIAVFVYLAENNGVIWLPPASLRLDKKTEKTILCESVLVRSLNSFPCSL